MRLILFHLLVIPFILTAQTQAWTGLSFEHEVTKKWGYFVDVEHRRSLTNDPEGRFLLLGAGSFQLSEGFSVAPGLRLEPANNGENATLRVFTDANYKYPLGESPFILEGRLRYQRERKAVVSGIDRRVAIRPRIGLVTKIRNRFAIVTEFEGRFRFDTRNEWSRVRYTAGLAYEATESISIELFGRAEDRINQASVRRDLIIGLYAEYTLPDGRKRDWEYRHPFGRRITW